MTPKGMGKTSLGAVFLQEPCYLGNVKITRKYLAQEYWEGLFWNIAFYRCELCVRLVSPLE